MASPLLFAQITTSAVNGTVKNNADEPLVGATIVATHQPSGTKYSTVSRAGGQFSIQNMRVGVGVTMFTGMTNRSPTLIAFASVSSFSFIMSSIVLLNNDAMRPSESPAWTI